MAYAIAAYLNSLITLSLYSELCGFHYVVISECVNKTAVLDTNSSIKMLHLMGSASW